MMHVSFLLTLAIFKSLPRTSADANASILLTRPEDGGIVPQTFDFGFELVVPGDPRLFTRAHATAELCVAVDNQPAQCFELFSSNLGMTDLALGPHVLEVM